MGCVHGLTGGACVFTGEWIGDGAALSIEIIWGSSPSHCLSGMLHSGVPTRIIKINGGPVIGDAKVGYFAGSEVVGATPSGLGICGGAVENRVAFPVFLGDCSVRKSCDKTAVPQLWAACLGVFVARVCGEVAGENTIDGLGVFWNFKYYLNRLMGGEF